MTEVLQRRFAAIGAHVQVDGPPRGEPRIDVVRGRDGEWFDIRFVGQGDLELEVVDVAPADRHLLLLVRTGGEKSKFLLGHDERHWFVAAVPEDARGVTGVAAAKLALQPAAVQAVVERKRPKDPFRRRNAAYVRQGEWFFVPAPELQVANNAVRRNEVLTRGLGGHAHVMQFAFQRGGGVVHVNRRYPRGLTRAQFEKLPEQVRRQGDWQQLVRDPEVYARGTVRHPDHATIHLPVWHRVLMNTEQRAQAMRHVAFID